MNEPRPARHDVDVVGVVGGGGRRAAARPHQDRVAAVHGAAGRRHPAARHRRRHARLAQHAAAARLPGAAHHRSRILLSNPATIMPPLYVHPCPIIV